jgi:hypothetical protein
MRMRHRVLRFVTLVSVTTMLVTPAMASQESATDNPAASSDAFCIYRGSDDTPELGPLPCDTSRKFMIGQQNMGRSPAVDSSEPADGASASPRGDTNTGRSDDVEAP